jgi:hypothetical protein
VEGAASPYICPNACVAWGQDSRSALLLSQVGAWQAEGHSTHGWKRTGIAAFSPGWQHCFAFWRWPLPPTPSSFIAGIIVQGQVIEARYEGHPDYPHVPTVLVMLQIERMLRGPAGERLSFREYLPGLRGRRGGKRGYLPGQRLLLFLPEPSRYGLSSPLGGEQGRFRIQRDQQGNDLAENDLGNAGLFRDLAPQAAQAGVSLSPEQARLAGVRRGPVPLEALVSLVRQFASAAGTE